MSLEISERSFEEAIECALLEYGPDACARAANVVRETSPPYGNTPPGGYHKRRPEHYDRALCLLPRDVVDFVLATQPKEWQKLAQHHGAAVKEQFLKRLSAEIEWRGMEASPSGDFFVRSGPGSVKLPPDSAREYIRTRFPGFNGPDAIPSAIS